MRVLMTAGILALPATAFAINTEPAGFYSGVGVSQVTYSGGVNSALNEKPEWTALELSGGYKQSPYVGLEARLGVGADPDLLYGALYYRTESANETAKTYLLMGYAGATIEAKTGDDLSLSGFSYGAGVGFPVGKNFNFNLEYRVLLDDSDKDISLNAFTASLDYRFQSMGEGFSGINLNLGDKGHQGFYAGLGLARIGWSVDESYVEDEFDSGDDEDMDDEGGIDLNWNALELIGGYSHGPLATVEVRTGMTDNAGSDGVDITLTYASIYYRPSITMGNAQIYGLLGYASVKDKFEETDEDTGEVYSDKATTSSFSWGVGVNYTIIDRLRLGLEYRLLAKDKASVDGEEESGSDTWKYTATSINVNYVF